MNKKGFTMVEIISVIVILGLIMSIVATNGFGVLENSKKKIKEDAIIEIAEGAKVFLTDVEYCDNEINEDILKKFKELEKIDSESCVNLQNKVRSSDCLVFYLSTLKDLDYVNSDAIDDIYEEDNNFSIKTCLVDKKIELTCTFCDRNVFKNVPADITLIPNE